jgi:hypothetical protein
MCYSAWIQYKSYSYELQGSLGKVFIYREIRRNKKNILKS